MIDLHTHTFASDGDLAPAERCRLNGVTHHAHRAVEGDPPAVVMAGAADGMTLYMSGKIGVSGDLFFSQRIAGVFATA